MSAVPAALALAALATAALLADRVTTVAVLALFLLAVCLRGPRGRRRVYLIGTLASGLGIFVLSPFLAVEGSHALWSGPSVAVVGPLDVTSEELELAGLNALRLVAVGLAFTAYALLLDHDRLLAAAGFARRSTFLVALATRLVPTLERDAAGLVEALRGRGIQVAGVRGHARLLSPLVSSSLERASSLAEAMEARGFGRPGATQAPRLGWTRLDRLALAAASLVAVAAIWL